MPHLSSSLPIAALEFFGCAVTGQLSSFPLLSVDGRASWPFRACWIERTTLVLVEECDGEADLLSYFCAEVILCLEGIFE